MSSSLEDGTARRGRKVTERPSGLDEPLVLAPSGAGLGWNAEPGAFRLPAVPMARPLGAAVPMTRPLGAAVPVAHTPRWAPRYVSAHKSPKEWTPPLGTAVTVPHCVSS